MEYTLEFFYYFFQAILNFIFSLPVTEGVTVGGVIFSVIILSSIFVSFGFRGKE